MVALIRRNAPPETLSKGRAAGAMRRVAECYPAGSARALEPAFQTGISQTMLGRYNADGGALLARHEVDNQTVLSQAEITLIISMDTALGAIGTPSLYELLASHPTPDGLLLSVMGGAMAGIVVGSFHISISDAIKSRRIRRRLAAQVDDCYDMLLEGIFRDPRAQTDIANIIAHASANFGIQDLPKAYEILDSGMVTSLGLEVTLARLITASEAEALLTAKKIKTDEAKAVLAETLTRFSGSPRDAVDFLREIEDGQ